MIYVFDITTTKNTSSSNKKKTVLRMEQGIIYKIEISFPPGSAGLLHLQINDALHQVWPTNEGASFSGDNVEIDFENEYPLIAPPYELSAYTWNEDELWDHDVTIRLGIKSIPGATTMTTELAEAMAGAPY